MIGILNIGLGNIQSVYNAIYENGYDPVLIDKPEQLEQLSHFILPGVGNFSAVSQQLQELGFVEAIKAFTEQGKPVLGICLGMQLLASNSCEGSSSTGLDIIKGSVLPIEEITELPVPHVGWNEVKFQQQHPIFDNIKDFRDFYFVHSYHFKCEHQNNVLASTDYGQTLTCIVAHNNVIGVQFHPEKSQKNGMQLLENFCEWDGQWQPTEQENNSESNVLC